MKIEHDVMDWSVDIDADVCNDIVEAEIEASQRIIHNVINEKRKLTSRVLKGNFFE